MSDSREFTFRDLILTDDFKEEEYSVESELTGITKYGQRKLGLALLQFIILYCVPENVPEDTREYIIVYAGAAHGTNISFVSKLCPHVEFHLYDPAPFSVSETDKIKIYTQGVTDNTGGDLGYFTDNEAEYWRARQKKTKNIFFLSDIRNVVDGKSNYVLQEQKISEDMEIQEKWVKRIRPVYSQLKFRLPYRMINFRKVSNRYIKYLPGKVFFGIWLGVSTETRLVTSAAESRRRVYWDVYKYERQLAYFNKYYRSSKWSISLPNVDFYVDEIGELGSDYDSVAEMYIFKMYLILIGGEEAATVDNIKELSEQFSRSLGNRRLRTLKDKFKSEFAPF